MELFSIRIQRTFQLVSTNERVSGAKKKAQHAVGTDGRLPKENRSVLTGKVT